MFVIAEFVPDMNSSDETISTTTSTVCAPKAKQFETWAQISVFTGIANLALRVEELKHPPEILKLILSRDSTTE